ncbi:MAG: hypothetical protein HYX52_06450 [Chloroflexi bacterium]|nr:hypothetical protein [Chloroflexota bacterium]
MIRVEIGDALGSAGDEAEPQLLRPDRASAFLAVLRGHEYERLCTFVLATGLRMGEALGLGSQDVDLDAKRIQVRQQLRILPGERPQLTSSGGLV